MRGVEGFSGTSNGDASNFGGQLRLPCRWLRPELASAGGRNDFADEARERRGGAVAMGGGWQRLVSSHLYQ
jgi:hypothetical protein